MTDVGIHDLLTNFVTVIIFFLLILSLWYSHAFYRRTTETEEDEEGSNTAVLVLVIIIISLLVALAVLLAMAYKAKSAETTPSNGTQKSGWQVEHVAKQKNKHSSSISGIGDGPGVVKTGEVNGGKKKRGRRKRSSSSPKVGVGSQIQLPKERNESTKQDATK